MKKQVLLVDDDPDYLLNMRLHLETAGFEVTAADTVKQARELLGRMHPDLAVVDLMLDEEDGGFVLCHHIKKLDARIPVIVVSAVTSETGLDFDASTSEERAWIKADAWLAKPVRFEQLQRELNRLFPEAH